ncbi:MAG TPA: spore coat U domain-containing protein [Thermoanaerobaculia bacterium]|nr:spore coat U domain-containing protein [Thermoanaerobaculia bacterium]
MCKRSLGLAFALSLVLAATLQAASSSAPLQVSAEVAPNCQIAISNLAFGKYDPMAQNAGAELDAAAEVTMLCTRSSRASVNIDFGRNGVGASRSLAGATQHVTYQLYHDKGRTQQWGGAGDGLQFVSQGIHKPEELTLYGRIPPGQEVASGVYTDVVTATVDF